MRALVLGSAGSQPTPKAGCDCRLCTLARRQGGRVMRTGPSLYLPEYGLLVDTPEEANLQLASRGLAPRTLLWTHAHPDHAAGMRVAQFLAKSAGRPVQALVPPPLKPVLEERFQLDYWVSAGYIELQPLPPGEPLEVAGLRVTALAHEMAEPVFSYVFESQNARGLYAPDHFRALPTPPGRFDWAVLQMPIPPLEALPYELPPDHGAWKKFYTFAEVTAAWRRKTRRLVFTHIYESAGMTPEELDAVAETAGDWVAFAHDGMEIAPARGRAPAERLAEFRAEQERIEREFADDARRMRAELRRLWERFGSQ